MITFFTLGVTNELVLQAHSYISRIGIRIIDDKVCKGSSILESHFYEVLNLLEIIEERKDLEITDDKLQLLILRLYSLVENECVYYNSLYLDLDDPMYSGSVIVSLGDLSFLQLIDTPNSYSGQVGKLVAVNDDETGLIFKDVVSLIDANNGLTNNSEVIQLGGQLIQDTLIDLNNNIFELTGLGHHIQLIDNDYLQTLGDISNGNYVTFELSSNSGDIKLVRLMSQNDGLASGIWEASTSSTINKMILGLTAFDIGKQNLNMTFDYGLGITIDDSQNNIGASYLGDYHVNGIDTFGDRWIPDWGAVLSRITTDLSGYLPLTGGVLSGQISSTGWNITTGGNFVMGNLSGISDGGPTGYGAIGFTGGSFDAIFLDYGNHASHPNDGYLYIGGGAYGTYRRIATTADIPSASSYIQNQTASPQSASFNINGTGNISGILAVGGNSYSYNHPMVVISKAVTDTDNSSHGVVDISTINSGRSYASFDIETNILDGLNYAGMHNAGFQSNGFNSATQPPDTIFSFTGTFTNNGGNITNYYGYYLNNPGGSGTYSSKFGLYISPITGASTNNYQIFAASTTGKSYIGGSLLVNKTTETPAAYLTVKSLATGHRIVTYENTLGNEVMAFFNRASGDGQININNSTGTIGVLLDGGAAAVNYFAGYLNAGSTSTTQSARVHISGGTATASTAPLKIDSGTLLGTTEAGAIENDGTHLYFTPSAAGTRYQLDRPTVLGTIATSPYTTAGILHNSVTTGAITSSLIVNADITNSTIDLTTKVTGILPGANGGTGVANTGKTITLGGNLTTVGAFGSTLTFTGITAVTLPTTGTLATLSGSESLTNKTFDSTTIAATQATGDNSTKIATTAFVKSSLDLIKASLTYPIRAAVWGDSRAHIGSGNNNDINLINTTNGNNGSSLIPGRIGGHLSVTSLGKIVPIADGGIGGQTSAQGIARDTSAYSATRKALTDMANLGAQVVYIYMGVNDLLAIRTSTTSPQITTILNTLYANITTTLQRCIQLGMYPIVISTEGNTYGSQAVSAGYSAADIQVQNPVINTANLGVQSICNSLGVLFINTHDTYVDLTVGSTYGNWLTTFATPLTEDGLHPNTNAALLISKNITDATLAALGSLPSKQIYVGNPTYPNLFDNPTFAKVTSGLATGITISSDAGTQTTVNTIGTYNNIPSQDFTVTPVTFDGNGVSLVHISLSIPVFGASPITQLGLTDYLQSSADIVIDDGAGGTPTGVQSYSCRMRLFYSGGGLSVYAFSPLYNDGLDTNRTFLSALIGRVTTQLYQVPDVSANLTNVVFEIFVGSTSTTPFRLRIQNPWTVKIPSTDLANSLRSSLTASLPVYTDAKGNLVTNTVQGTGATVQATSPTIASPTFTGTTNASTIGVTTINSNSANFFMGSQTAAVTQSASQFQLGGATNTYLRFGGGSTTGTTLSASASAANLIVGTSIYTTAASGTNPIITSLGIKPPTVTVTGGSTVTTTSTLHIDGTPTTGSNPVAISIKGNTSGIIGIGLQAAAGTYNFNLPTTAGTSGQALLSGGGSTSPMTWASLQSKPHTIFTPTTGGTVTLINNQYNIVNPAGTLATLTVTLPSTPSNNDCVFIKFTQNVTTVTYSGGTISDGVISPIAGGLVVLVYDSGASTWY